jgi:drug/metabolite transporter (DMT)-like permease
MYVVVAVLGRFVVDEKVTPRRWVGIALACVGVSVIASTSLRTTDHSGGGTEPSA